MLEKIDELEAIMLGRNANDPRLAWLREKFDALRSDATAQLERTHTKEVVRPKKLAWIMAMIALIVGIAMGSLIHRPVLVDGGSLDEGTGDSLMGPGIVRYWDSELDRYCWLSTLGGISCQPPDPEETEVER